MSKLIIITFSRLTITFAEVQNLIGLPVIDGVVGLQRGSQMESGIVYYFYGIGSAVVKQSSSEAQNLNERLRNESSFIMPPDNTPLYQRDVLDIAVLPVEADEEGDDIHAFLRPDIPPEDVDGPIAPPDREGVNPPRNLTDINALAAEKSGITGKNIKIAILDAGVARHKDLNLQAGESFIDGDPLDALTGHGTRCAGIAAGKITGVAPDAIIYSVKVADAQFAYPQTILAGLCWCLRHSMDVISINFATKESDSLIPAFTNAAQALLANDCLVVAPAGGANSVVGFPAITPGFIAVGMYAKCGHIDGKSNSGGKLNQISVVAPCEAVPTTYYRDNEYRLFDGSSATAPHVVGAVALLKERLTGVSAMQIVASLLGSATRLAGQEPYTTKGGVGLVNCATLMNSRIRVSPQIRGINIMSRSSHALSDAPGTTVPVHANVARTNLSVNLVVGAIAEGDSEFYTVAIVAADGTRREQHIHMDVAAMFKNIKVGRYDVTAQRDDGGVPTEPRGINLTQPGMDYSTTIYINEPTPIGRITVYVTTNGGGEANVNVMGPEPTTGPRYNQNQNTEGGIAVFEGTKDGDPHTVTACLMASCKTKIDSDGNGPVFFDFP